MKASGLTYTYGNRPRLLTATARVTVVAPSAISSLTLSPFILTLNASTQNQFTATVTGTGSYSSGVIWSAQKGTITSTGLYTAPVTGGSDVVTATSAQDANRTATANITVTVPATITSVVVSPASLTLNASAQNQFTATVTGTGGYSSGVTWSAQKGTITSTGLYTAPATSGSDVVTATSAQNASRTATANITVTVPATITSVVVSPASLTLNASAQNQFTATVTGTGGYSSRVIWSAQKGTITSTGLYTAPATGGSDVVTATSAQNASRTAMANITVTVPATITSVVVSPASLTLNASAQNQFTATVTGTGSYSSGVTWSAQKGAITSTGLYTAPATGGSDVVTATSAQDASRTATANITVTVPATITSVVVSPASLTLNASAQNQFTATVTGTGSYSPGVTWSAQKGTITSTGLYTAPTTSGSDVVTATSAQNASRTATANITVTVPATITSVVVSPASLTLNVSAQNQFTATVVGTGSYSSGVTWSAQKGAITSTGLYTALTTGGSDVVTATSAQDVSRTATANITVTVPATITSVVVSPASLVLDASAQEQFTVTVTGTGSFSSGVTWSAQRGSITSAGLYTAPATGGSDVVTATSVQDTTKAVSSNITVSGSLSPILPAWTGTGSTRTVYPGEDIQAILNSASAGDTIELADGTWTGVHLTITKMVRLKSLNPLGARLQGYVQPTAGTDNGIAISGGAAAGTFIQDLDVSWYGSHGIGVMHSGSVVISGCHIESCGDQGIFLWDTANVVIYGNRILDPYLSGMLPTLVDDSSNTNWTANNSLVLMDYGVQAYGTVRTQVLQNYFHGQFNQAVSFKEANRDYTVSDNTFEGFTGSGVLCGQNIGNYGPFTYSGQPISVDTGTLHIEGNIFRPVVGLQDGHLAEYRANAAIRMGHLNQAIVYVRGNTIEAAISGLSVEMGMNGVAGGPTGTLFADHNIVNGNIWDDGTMVSATAKTRLVGRWNAISMDSGVLMNVVITNDTYANSSHAVSNFGMLGTLTIDRTIFLNNVTNLSGAGTVTNSIFYPSSALPGTGNLAANPQVSTTTVPLRKYNPEVLVPTSDLSKRFRPSSLSSAKSTDGTYAGAVAP